MFSAVGVLCFTVLANFVEGASAYFCFYFYFNRASESEDQGINLVWLNSFESQDMVRRSI